MTGTTVPQPDSNPALIVAVDGSALSYQAAAWAASDAVLHGCAVRIVSSISPPPSFGPAAILTEPDMDWLRTDAERVVNEAARVARAAVAGEVSISTEITLEPIVSHLIVLSGHARAVVVGSRGLGALRRGLLGSVSSAIVQHAHCPVAVIHSATAADPVSASRPILVGVDGTRNSVPAVELAFQEASLRKVGVTALLAWSDVTAPSTAFTAWQSRRTAADLALSEELAGFGERYPDVHVRRIVVMDRPVRALLEESENAQLVVVGSRGRGGFTGMLLGSTSTALLHSIDRPIVVVRGD